MHALAATAAYPNKPMQTPHIKSCNSDAQPYYFNPDPMPISTYASRAWDLDAIRKVFYSPLCQLRLVAGVSFDQEHSALSYHWLE